MRQGDPLSPFPFLIAAEGLNVIINEAVSITLFRGVFVGSERIHVSHLQYADDTIIYGDSNVANAGNLMRIMKCMQNVSGLKINFKKSKVFGVGFQDEDVVNIAIRMGCETGRFPLSYLGKSR